MYRDRRRTTHVERCGWLEYGKLGKKRYRIVGKRWGPWLTDEQRVVATELVRCAGQVELVSERTGIRTGTIVNWMKRDEIREEIVRLLAQQEGTTPVALVETIRSLLQTADLQIRARGVELLAKLYGAFAPEQREHTVKPLPAEEVAKRHARMATLFADWESAPPALHTTSEDEHAGEAVAADD